ncbi:ABC transporter substrate-binding protein [Cognatitamlana onchidii]|uniref:ABC transporter substrate-binding protein n=1 Tax=Cognatitamlana onchidii TaxID=2562860 RepID=UPI0010A62B6C|nr:ABC transporter substrate-binding protein [Algibacter onchidii]
MQKTLLLLVLLVFTIACKTDKKQNLESNKTVLKKETLKYAKGFSITHYDTHKEIVVTSPWPNSLDTLHYILVNKGSTFQSQKPVDAMVECPVDRSVVMSTTNIPALEYLGIDQTLVGFPGTHYISSEKTRNHIENGKIKDLNSDLEINMELLLDLNPELVIGYTVNGMTKSLDQIKKFGIPLVLDGAWTEQHPLGRAEWIKFVAAFFNQEQKADSIFNQIERNYLEAKQLVSKTKTKPVIFSGSMFKDVWHVPGGQSFIAQYFEDASTHYLWKDDDSTGSLQFNFENILEKADEADIWIGAGSFENKSQMLEQSEVYSYFKPFKNNVVYSYTKNIGPNGGLLYYELGSLRPDLILKDIIYIAHPEVLPNYETFFFKPIE